MTHELPVLRELALLAGCSLAIILLGPGGFGLVRDPAPISTLAEIGVVLLLFTVGLEFSLADLRRLGAFPAGLILVESDLRPQLMCKTLLLTGRHALLDRAADRVLPPAG